nr:FCD domain-containing protein [Conexibacter sp. S30A1]
MTCLRCAPQTCASTTLAEAAGNQVAGALVAWSYLVLEPELDAVIAPAVVDAILLEQHRHIFAAVQARSSRRAEAAMLSHLRYIGDVLETVAPVRSAPCR